jgi:hypothetical protein
LRLKATFLALAAVVAAMTAAYASNPVPLYQMDSLYGSGRIWTSDNVSAGPYDHGTLGFSYKDMNTEHHIDGTMSAGLEPLIELYNAGLNDMYLTTDQNEADRFADSNYVQVPQYLGYVRDKTAQPIPGYIAIYVSTNSGIHAFGDYAHITRLGPGWSKGTIAFYLYHIEKEVPPLYDPTDNPLYHPWVNFFAANTLYQDVDSPYYIATSPYAIAAYLESALVADGYSNYSTFNTIDQANQGGEALVDVLQDQSGTYYYDTVLCLAGSAEYTKYTSSPYKFTNETAIGWGSASNTGAYSAYTEIEETFNSSTHQHQYGTAAQMTGLANPPWITPTAVFWIHS